LSRRTEEKNKFVLFSPLFVLINKRENELGLMPPATVVVIVVTVIAAIVVVGLVAVNNIIVHNVAIMTKGVEKEDRGEE
jgi:hypothetical protein